MCSSCEYRVVGPWWCTAVRPTPVRLTMIVQITGLYSVYFMFRKTWSDEAVVSINCNNAISTTSRWSWVLLAHQNSKLRKRGDFAKQILPYASFWAGFVVRSAFSLGNPTPTTSETEKHHLRKDSCSRSTVLQVFLYGFDSVKSMMSSSDLRNANNTMLAKRLWSSIGQK